VPASLKQRLSNYEGLFGANLAASQFYLFVIALSVYCVQVLLVGGAGFFSTILYTFIAGNTVALLVSAAAPLYDQPFPRNWIIFVAILFPASGIASTAGAVLERSILHIPLKPLLDGRSTDIAFGGLIVFIIGGADYLFSVTRARMQATNEQLAQQVQLGRQQLESHASELQAAFDIQSSLLPRTIPQINGVEISCAWQPARTVSGDFFDVLVLSPARVGLCLADVSGKGMSAALITANLQATFRAFAPSEPSPARLCAKLNDALCANLPPGRFVTLVYAVLDRERMTLTYELAGHNPPLLLRGMDVVLLPGTGPVLGLLPSATFRDQTIGLHAGDRILFSTDGVTEAFNPAEEEFGEERMIATAQATKGSAHDIRSAIMHDVTTFAQDHFHDDASLMIITVA
jgi:sigma-B regulation protein RsbU (phosphoserine phosphatase)